MIKTLLLADDSVVIQKLVGLSFANESVELITTNNGEDAIARAKEARPDLILADVVMPGRNGYEVCEAIKKDPALSHIPVLLLTGTFEAFDEERAVRVGSSGHITKPFEAQALVDRINELLEQTAAEPSKLSPVTSEAPPAAADEAFDFVDEDPAPVSAREPSPASEPLAPPPQANAQASEDFNAAETAPAAASDSFTFGAELDSDAISPSGEAGGPGAATAREQGADRTIAMIPQAPAAPQPGAPTRASTMDFDELGAIVLPDETPGAGAPGSPLASGMGGDPAATQLVPDALESGGGPPNLPKQPVNPSISSAVGFGPADLEPPLESPAPEITPGDTLLADDLFGESQSDIEPLAVAGESAELIEDFDLEPPVRPVAQPQLDAEPSMPVAADDGIDDLSRSQILDDESAVSNLETQPLADRLPASPTRDALPVAPESAPMSSPKAPGATARIEPAPETGESAQATPDLSPMMRARLHESLEKIAWEAFADVSDTIVRQVIKRVESVAWEVIPKMAEALIQEEIRRMKGDPE